MKRGVWAVTAAAILVLALVVPAFAAEEPSALSIVYSSNINGNVLPCPT
jgi:hypothetical protein